MIPKIVELKITEDELSGVEAIAFVEEPAIEVDFLFFNKQTFEDTFNDYPKKAIANAKRGIELNKENGNKCATQVGKVRAQQLANGEKVSLDTIRRMRSFLIRQKDNYELAIKRKDYTACGYISYLLWGGAEALPWAEKKLRQAGEDFAEVGERGGIRKSPKAPKSKTKNPNPKGRGTAKGNASTTRGAKVDKATEKTLKKKSDDFNERYKDKLGYGATIGQLKAVYQRGLGAYNTSRSPEVAKAGGAKQWAMARVNAYLYLLKNGRPQNKKYTTDYDLLPKKHPKAEAMSKILEGLLFEKTLELNIDVSALPNYVDEVSEEDKYNDWIEDLTDDIEDAVYNALINVGRTEDDLIDEGYDFNNAIVVDEKDSHIAHAFVASVNEIKSEGSIRPVADKPSNEDYGQWAVLYRYMRYNGKPEVGNNSRKFCQNVIQANRYYRKEDINQLTLKGANEGFGLNGQKFYDIFKFKGGKNCQHFWQEVLVPRFKEDKDRKRPSAVSDRITEATSLNPDTLSNLYREGRLAFSQDEMDEKQLVATPIMIPNKLIPRRDESGDKYHVFFSDETIKDIAYKFAQAKLVDNINHEHDMNSMVDDIYLAESWIVEEPSNDKSNTYGYNLPKGTWFGLFKIDNDDYWNDYIKNGKVKGVSVEGFFVNKLSALK